MSKIIATVSQKGGVGKTSLVQNLGAELAKRGQRVLLVDFDPQSNLTIGWGLDPLEARLTVYDALLAPARITEAVVRVRPKLDLLPTSLDLAGADPQFAAELDRHLKLRKALAPVREKYQYIIIDGPPSLGFFTSSAMVAATDILIPLQVHAYAYKALDQLLPIVEKVQELNSKLRIMGIVLTMYDRRNALTDSIERTARNRFEDLIFTTTIPVNIKIAEAPLDGVSVAEYAPASAGAKAYQLLAEEVLQRG
jgi:chromosome partitioning protein